MQFVDMQSRRITIVRLLHGFTRFFYSQLVKDSWQTCVVSDRRDVTEFGCKRKRKLCVSYRPAEGVDGTLKVLPILVVVGVVGDVVVVAVCRMVDVLVLRHHSHVVDTYSYPQPGLAVPQEVRRLD